jgi:hypothetical protein
MKRLEDYSYNDRLFSGGFRSRLHMARFLCLRKTLQKLECPCKSLWN